MAKSFRSSLLVLLALMGLASTVWAHPDLQNPMWVQLSPSLVRVAINVSLKELSVAQGCNLTNTGILNHAAEKHRDYVLKHLSISAGTNALTGRVVSLSPPSRIGEPEQTVYQYELEYPLPSPPPTELRFSHDMLREWPYAAATPWDISYVVRTKWSDSEGVTTWLLGSRQTEVVPTGWSAAETPPANPLTPKKQENTFRDYLRHGVLHILGGYDHLLFVAALVVATVSFWEMLKVVAVFTLAHTLTLGLCVFGLIRLPPFIVEPVIALSIVMVALENVLRPERARSRIRLAVAFGFGLIHGLGFAGGLLDAMQGLPTSGIWLALCSFSLGVEIGHQLVVLPLFGLLLLGRHKWLHAQHHPSLVRWSSALISACGAYYLVIALRQQVFTR